MEQTAAATMTTRSMPSKTFSEWLAKIDIPAYGKGEDLFNAISHLAGVLLGLFAFGWFLSAACENPSAPTIAGVSIYSFSLIALYGVSGTYHLLRPGDAKRVMRVMDHCTIYLLIAGCYTPILLIAFWSSWWAPIMLATEWGIAVVGIVINAIDMTSKRVKTISLISYVVMGWMIVLIPFDQLTSMGTVWFYWVLAGGIAYMLGMIFYGVGSKVRYMHCIWHIFVLAGSILQFIGFVQML